MTTLLRKKSSILQITSTINLFGNIFHKSYNKHKCVEFKIVFCMLKINMKFNFNYNFFYLKMLTTSIKIHKKLI